MSSIFKIISLITKLILVFVDKVIASTSKVNWKIKIIAGRIRVKKRKEVVIFIE